MEKQTKPWSVQELVKRHSSISFPEYQREPSVWKRAAKQRLIDSMLRQFDVASIYFYRDVDDSLECIDGRQRIGAIMSFLGKNPDDVDNGFNLNISNEIFEDDADFPFTELDSLTYDEICARAQTGDNAAKNLIESLLKYQLTVVELAKSHRAEEFNLQFIRLNLGTIINSGEKLHAMTGEMREVCFAEGNIGKHDFLERIAIPTRRFSKEQVAAQILAQVFSLKETGGFTRTRHFDLQKFFKTHARLEEQEQLWVAEVASTLDALHAAFEDPGILRNRALTVSTVLLAVNLGLTDEDQAKPLAAFIEEFLCRLQWQVKKGLDVDDEYRYLIDFQKHVTQASVEKPAVTARSTLLEAEFGSWTTTSMLSGDEDYAARKESQARDDCREKAT